jgi:hypothetical protein
VDQPPLIAAFACLTRHLYGTSVFAIRLFPAFASFALVSLTGLLAHDLGGERFAQALAALCSACAGVYLILGHRFILNMFEPLLWMSCSYVVTPRYQDRQSEAMAVVWCAGGHRAGEQLLDGGVRLRRRAGLRLTRERKAFASPRIWAAGAIAFPVFLPNLLWNVQHHFPFLESMRNIKANGRDTVFTPPGYLKAQIFLMAPVAFPECGLWAARCIFSLGPRASRFACWVGHSSPCWWC